MNSTTSVASIVSLFEPGQLIFDYYNAAQLADLAQSLGLDLELSRSISREASSKSGAKATIKILEVSGERSSNASESATISGALPTAIFWQILGLLRRNEAIYNLDLSDNSGEPLDGSRIAFLANKWLLVTGEFDVNAKSFTLTRGQVSDPFPGVTVHLSSDDSELTATGRIRLRRMLRIRAEVLALAEACAENPSELVLVAYAIFSRAGGDSRFRWEFSYYDPGSSGAGSDWNDVPPPPN